MEREPLETFVEEIVRTQCKGATCATAKVQNTVRRDGNGMCTSTFVVHPESHARMREWVEDDSEHGGNFSVDYKNKQISLANTTGGIYNRIQLPRGTFDAHSHPRKCKDGRCAVGLPSPLDLLNVLLGITNGGTAHMVYSPKVTYVIQVKPELLSEHKAQPDRFESKLTSVVKDFMPLHKRFEKGDITEDEYDEEWEKLADKHGFAITKFKPHEIPSIQVTYPCDRADNVVEKVHVPASYNSMIANIPVK